MVEYNFLKLVFIKLFINIKWFNVLFNCCVLFQLNFEDIVLHKVLPICLSHIRHCQQVEKGEKIARHYAVSSRKVEIMYLKKVSLSLMPFILRQNDIQCKYELNLIINEYFL